MAQGAQYHDIPIENEPLLMDRGFTKFSLPVNGNVSKMVLYNDKDHSMTTYVDFDKHSLDNSVKLLHYKLVVEQQLDTKAGKETVEDLVAYFRNIGHSLQEDPGSEYFKNGNGNDNGKEKKEQSESAAQKLLKLAQDQCEDLFLDQFGAPYAAVRIGEHFETLPLKDSRFRNWLCRIYYTEENNVLNSESISNVLNVLKAKAEFEGSTRNLSLRVTSITEEPFTIYYDLANKDWRVVKVTPDGWTVEYCPIIFRRYKSQQPQVYPSREYTPDVFDRFMDLMNIKDEDDKVLVKGYLISLFYPDIPKPILILMAEQGSAKTTEQELEKMTVDPSSTLTLTFPRDIHELVQKLSHNYIAYFDNVSKLQDWVSDQLCRAATGSGFSKRELYTDDEDVIYNFVRCIGINGINIGGLKPDLLDRSIIRKREPISKEKRRKKHDVHAEFESIRPQLLGYIFDILSKVLQVKSKGGIKIDGLPRMADFAEIGEIACRCMGYDDNRFLNAYYKNIQLQVDVAIAANLVSNAIIKFMEDKNEWTGTATELLTGLQEAATELKINVNAKAWPKGANVLSGRLNEVKTNLREIGIIIDNEAAKNPKTRVKTIMICKQSFEPFTSFAGKNHAQVTSDNANDTDESERYNRSHTKQSFEENDQNHAQNIGPNDSSDANDTLHTLQGSYSDSDSDYPTICYYCDYKPDSREYYERHVANRHHLPAYPNRAEIGKRGLKLQGKDWEI
jgi:hypothetical protein